METDAGRGRVDCLAWPAIAPERTPSAACAGGRAGAWPGGAGHRAGAAAVRRVVESAPRAGIGVLTLYSFSSDNWQRPPAEVKALMSLFQSYLRMETNRCVKEGVRIRMIGRRDRLAPPLQKAVAQTAAVTRTGQTLDVR